MRSPARELRSDVKHHDAPLHGVVANLIAEENYGFVRMPDESEIYFNKNAVVGGRFEDLTVGAEVRVAIAEGESAKGPQATMVRAIAKHHIVKR